MSNVRVSAVVRHIRKLATAREEHELPDDQLLDRFAARQDEAAFAALLTRHGPMVLGVCRSVLHDLHDAEDAFQAAFLLLAQKAGAIQRREAVSSWLYRVAYHLAVRAKATAARRRVIEKRAVPIPAADPVLDLSLREVRTLLFEELNALQEQYRAPLVLCGLEDKSLDEAARLLGRTRGTVKGRLQRGRALLRVRLRRRGLELPAGLFATVFGIHSTAGRVSATLANATVHAALKMAAGGPVAASLVSAEVAALVQDAGLAVYFSKAKIGTALFLTVSLAVTAVGVLWHQAAASDPPASQQSRAQQPKPQENAARTDAQPAPEGTIRVQGRVLDPEGKPVAAARLYLGTPAGEGKPYAVRATSGDDGQFQFTFSRSELDPVKDEDAPAQVLAVAVGHGCDWTPLGPVGKDLTLRLVKDVPLCMRILNPEGKPVAGAKLRVMGLATPQGDDLGAYLEAVRKGEGYAFARHWHGPLPGQPSVLTTDTDGRFRLAGAGRERIVHLRVEGPAIGSAGLDAMTRAADSVKNPRGWTHVYGAASDYVGFAIRPIRGVVRDKETGKPLAGVVVGHPGSWVNNRTDQEGRYDLLGEARSPKYSLLAKPADGLHFERLVQVQDIPGPAPLNCDIVLVRGLTVRGRVTDKTSGQPVAGAHVEYRPLGGNTYVDKLLPGSWDPRAEAAAGPEGSYTLTVMPGPGVLAVTAPKWDRYMPAAMSLQERKAFFKTPLIDDKDEDGLTWYAGDGSYGGISFDFYHAVVLLEPDEKEKAIVKDVALERALERQGRVVGPDDRPLTGVRVCGLARFGVETLSGDAFTVRGINPRASRPLVFYQPEKNLGFYVKDLREKKSGPLTIKLQPCGSASGRVVDRDGKPVAGLRVHVMGHALRITGEAGGGWQTVATDAAGRFRAEGLVPGQEYVVWEWDESPSFPRVYATVVVESGRHKEMGNIKMTERGK